MFYGSIHRSRWGAAALCSLLMACSTTAQTPPTSSPSIDPQSMLTGPGQVLPITAQATISDTVIDLEVAHTPEQQSLGLMHRRTLPDNRGMLFPNEQPRRVRFWMKDVPVALDMVFLLEGRVQGYVTAPPCEGDPCPTYGPGNLLVDQVIELREGRASELGLEVGDIVEVEFL